MDAGTKQLRSSLVATKEIDCSAIVTNDRWLQIFSSCFAVVLASEK